MYPATAVLIRLLLAAEIGFTDIPVVWMLQDPSTFSVVDLA